MTTVESLLAQKERDLARVKREVGALYLVAPLLSHMGGTLTAGSHESDEDLWPRLWERKLVISTTKKRSAMFWKKARPKPTLTELPDSVQLKVYGAHSERFTVQLLDASQKPTEFFDDGYVTELEFTIPTNRDSLDIDFSRPIRAGYQFKIETSTETTLLGYCMIPVGTLQGAEVEGLEGSGSHTSAPGRISFGLAGKDDLRRGRGFCFSKHSSKR